MRIFLSYRRVEEDFLAHFLARALPTHIPTASVFLDTISIAPGADFETRILAQVSECDVFVALIGPRWSPERLSDERDYVRMELLQRHGRQPTPGLIVPVLYNGGRIPRPRELSGEMRWLSGLNAVTLTGSSNVEEDVRRLAAELMGRGPESLDLYRRFRTFYEAAQFKDLVVEATRTWDTHADHPTAALAECCRLASLSLLQLGDSQAYLWRARAIAVAYKSGSSNSLAATLFSMFFTLLDYGDFEGAQGVLREVDRLTAEDDDSQVPGRDVMRRTYHEKSAYLLFLRGEYQDSIGHYEQALQESGEDLRGACKVRGGLANSKYLLGFVREAARLAQVVLEEARLNGWTTEAEVAELNLREMRAGGRGLRPYEVT